MNSNFWRMAIERAIKTAIQAVILAVSAAKGADLFALDIKTILGAAAGGALVSILTSIASEPFGTPNSPTLLKFSEPTTATPASPTGETAES